MFGLYNKLVKYCIAMKKCAVNYFLEILWVRFIWQIDFRKFVWKHLFTKEVKNKRCIERDRALIRFTELLNDLTQTLFF